jgi:hypothetical protein
MGAVPVDEPPQQLQLLVIDDRPEAAHAHADQRDGVGVGVVGLATLPGSEDPHPCRQLCWDVDHGLAFGDEALRDVATYAFAALDRPDPVRPGRDVGQHRGESLDVGGEATTSEDLLVAGHYLDRHRPLVRVHADHDAFVVVHGALLPARLIAISGVRRAPLLPAEHSLLEPLPPRRCPGQRTPNLSHTTHVDSAIRATTPDT